MINSNYTMPQFNLKDNKFKQYCYNDKLDKQKESASETQATQTSQQSSNTSFANGQQSNSMEMFSNFNKAFQNNKANESNLFKMMPPEAQTNIDKEINSIKNSFLNIESLHKMLEELFSKFKAESDNTPKRMPPEKENKEEKDTTSNKDKSSDYESMRKCFNGQCRNNKSSWHKDDNMFDRYNRPFDFDWHNKKDQTNTNADKTPPVHNEQDKDSKVNKCGTPPLDQSNSSADKEFLLETLKSADKDQNGIVSQKEADDLSWIYTFAPVPPDSPTAKINVAVSFTKDNFKSLAKATEGEDGIKIQNIDEVSKKDGNPDDVSVRDIRQSSDENYRKMNDTKFGFFTAYKGDSSLEEKLKKQFKFQF